jgi:SAM-dependent methyltransferase
MQYDPIKNIFAGIIKKYPSVRVLFYKSLDIMFLRSWYVRRELRDVRRLFAEKEISIFDAGTGYGQYTYYMSRKMNPCRIYAGDIKTDWINDCRDFFKRLHADNVKFGVEDLTKFQAVDAFDLIICVDVMEHIENDSAVFANFYKALRKGGYLLINTPSVYGGSDAHNDEDESFIGEHFRSGYSIEDLKNKMEPLGFHLHHFRYGYGVWGDFSWRLAIKYPMLMLNKSKLLFFALPFYYLLSFVFIFILMFIDYAGHNKIGAGINVTFKK